MRKMELIIMHTRVIACMKLKLEARFIIILPQEVFISFEVLVDKRTNEIIILIFVESICCTSIPCLRSPKILTNVT